ncbi:hypothetical protein [Lacinutrix neustonica]|uniref:hypothetical protein n=1 Tax=Lacinutrix neustonica TaxID=2980107 RepID=UPI0028BF5618|nr:hypothetical protein [Lacinutrix neustonica]
MELNVLLNEANFTVTVLEVDVSVTFEEGSIAKICFNLEGDVPNIEVEQFQ